MTLEEFSRLLKQAVVDRFGEGMDMSIIEIDWIDIGATSNIDIEFHTDDNGNITARVS